MGGKVEGGNCGFVFTEVILRFVVFFSDVFLSFIVSCTEDEFVGFILLLKALCLFSIAISGLSSVTDLLGHLLTLLAGNILALLARNILIKKVKTAF